MAFMFSVQNSSTLADAEKTLFGLPNSTAFTTPTLSALTAPSVQESNKYMLWIGVAGLALGALTYFKRGR